MRRVRELWLVDVPALGYAVAAAVGVLAGILGFLPEYDFALALAVTVIAAMGLLFVKSRRLTMLLVLAAFAVVVSCRASDALQRDSRRRVATEFSDPCTCEAIGRICWKEPARDDRSGYLWLDQAKLIADSNECACGELKIRLRVPVGEWDSAQIGEIAAGNVRFVPAQRMYTSQSGILFWSAAKQHCGDASLREGEALDLVKGDGSVRNSLFELRETLLEALETYLSPDARAMCGALLLGERVGFSPEFRGDLYLTGLTHLFALSGLNTGLIAALMWFGLSLLRTPLLARGLIVLGVLALYAALGVGVPSLVRSSLMAAMIIGTRLLHRKGNSANYIVAAFAIELLIWPLHALDAGFLLSYLAIAGLTAGYAALAEPFAKWFGEGKIAAVRRPAQLVGSAISAQISTAPITAMLFGRVAGLAVLANIIAVPGFSLLLVLTILLIATSFVSGVFAGWIANSVDALSFILTRVVTWSAMIPGAGFTVNAPAFVFLGWLVLSVSAIVALLRLRARWAIAFLLIALNGVIWSDVLMDSDEPFVAHVNERSVLLGAGEATVLVGCGSPWESERAGSDVLQAMQTRRRHGLDVIVLPVGWASSIGALPGVLQSVDAGSVLWVEPSNGTWTSALLDATLEHEEIVPIVARAGTILQATEELSIQVLWPVEGIQEESVMLIEMSGGARVLLITGQAPEGFAAGSGALQMSVLRGGEIGTGNKQFVHGEWEFARGSWLRVDSDAERYAGWLKLPYAS